MTGPRTIAYNRAKITHFDLVQSTDAPKEEVNSNKKKHFQISFINNLLDLPTIADFPLNRMMVGESFHMHRLDHWPGRFSDVRERVRRCNATKAAYFVCVWINDRKTLEVARVA